MDNKKNMVRMIGTLLTEFQLCRITLGEKFYHANIEIKRLSGTNDIIQVQVSEKLVDASTSYMGKQVSVFGEFRSFNQKNGEKRHTHLYVLATSLLVCISEIEDVNDIQLDGFICKPTVFRKTPKGRYITELWLAVNRPDRGSDYIPCIAWGNNALRAAIIEVGTRISIKGRIQSRTYLKRLSDQAVEERVAYEVSIAEIQVIE